MLSHSWETKSDWEYCTIEGCDLYNNNVVLNSQEGGTILSDIRDSSTRLYKYCEVIPKVSVKLGTTALLYIRSGYTSEYVQSAWTDWSLVNEPMQRMEYTLSLTKNKIILDYNVQKIQNIYCINNDKYQALAMQLDTIYLTPLTDADANNTAYSYLWSGLVDEAIVDFAKVDQDGEPLTIYAENATFAKNVITLKNPLPDDNVIVIVKYVPRYYIYEGVGRYIQFKIELNGIDFTVFKDADDATFLDANGATISTGDVATVSTLATEDKKDFLDSDGNYINVHTINPYVSSIIINYKLDYQKELEESFPAFFRRL